MIVAIHQPEHLPWLGFFDKAARADLLVILDCVQFRKNYFQNRNRIRTPDGSAWITVPVRQPVTAPILEIKVDTQPRLRQRYLNLVRQSYQRAPFFGAFFPALEAVIAGDDDRLVDVNMKLLRLVFEAIGISTPTVVASSLHADLGSGPTDVNLNICKAVGARTYLSGISGRDYLDRPRFAAAGIDIEFHEFHHPIYRQRYQPFVPCMSAVDVLFNHGPESANILRGIGVEVMEEVIT